MRRPLSYFKRYKCYNEKGEACGNLNTLLRRHMDDQDAVVEKIETNRGPHGFVRVADVDIALAWAINALQLDVNCVSEDEIKQEGVDYSPPDSFLKRTSLAQKETIKDLKDENLKLRQEIAELNVQLNPPYTIMKSKVEILERAREYFTKCGIYFLIDHGDIVYVGQSVNVESRVATHAIEGTKEFSHYSFVPCEKQHLNNIEALYIKHFDPKYNTSMPIDKISLRLFMESLQKGA